jgi:energy-coupling factor transport system ATP-binding protein
MIQVKNLSFRYDEQLVLKDIDLEIKEGSFMAIIGANGSGKSTLGKHFNALLLPTKGSVLVDAIDTKKNQYEIRKKVGFVFQNFEDQIVYPIVGEDIAFGLENLELKTEDIKRIVGETLEKLKIKHLVNSNVNTLSLGQKQLVALAGVLAMQPQYIIFDEPTTMLDVANKKNILSVIKTLNEKNKLTIIMVTNALEDLQYAEHVVVLKAGKIIFNDKRELLNKKILDSALAFSE